MLQDIEDKLDANDDLHIAMDKNIKTFESKRSENQDITDNKIETIQGRLGGLDMYCQKLNQEVGEYQSLKSMHLIFS